MLNTHTVKKGRVETLSPIGSANVIVETQKQFLGRIYEEKIKRIQPAVDAFTKTRLQAKTLLALNIEDIFAHIKGLVVYKSEKASGSLVKNNLKVLLSLPVIIAEKLEALKCTLVVA